MHHAPFLPRRLRKLSGLVTWGCAQIEHTVALQNIEQSGNHLRSLILQNDLSPVIGFGSGDVPPNNRPALLQEIAWPRLYSLSAQKFFNVRITIQDA